MKQNIFENIPDKIPDEIFETLINHNNVKVERIISKGQTSPIDFWYNQDVNEWIILLKSHAKLLFEKGELIELLPGDHINIPVNTKHRVEWTDSANESIWLAVFY